MPPPGVPDRRHTGQVDDTSLGRCRRRWRSPRKARSRRRVHDGATATLEQLRNGALGGAKHGGEAEIDDVAPHVLLDVSGKGQAAPSRWQRRLPERIVVEDVEPAECLHRASDHGFDARQRPRIGP